MAEKVLMRGTHVIGESAVRSGCRFYFGYPITPQNELTEYMASALASLTDGVFIQAESELAAINMVIGASMAGKRAMTSSSSPGISLKQEGISFLSAQQLPAVIVNTMRGGPGLGNIAPSQGDYFQATRGGGHGDYRTIVLAPSTGQELADFTRMAFEYADHYRIPVLILCGRHDAVTPLAHGDNMAQRLLKAQLIVFEHSGHLLWLEEEDKFVDCLINFLRKE